MRWIAKEEGDGAGFDVLSFDDSGQEMYIEVKTTNGGNRTPFFISQNEVSFAKRNSERFCLRRIYNFRRSPRIFDLDGSLDDYVTLRPESYRSQFEF